MTFFSSSVFKILIIVLDLQNALNVPGTTSPSSSIFAPAGENFRVQLSQPKNFAKKLGQYMSNKFLSKVRLVHVQQVSVHCLDHRSDEFQQQSRNIVLLPLWCHVNIPVFPQLLISKFFCKHDVLEQLM